MGGPQLLFYGKHRISGLMWILASLLLFFLTGSIVFAAIAVAKGLSAQKRRRKHCHPPSPSFCFCRRRWLLLLLLKEKVVETLVPKFSLRGFTWWYQSAPRPPRPQGLLSLAARAQWTGSGGGPEHLQESQEGGHAWGEELGQRSEDRYEDRHEDRN